jgi:hypothetical protein
VFSVAKRIDFIFDDLQRVENSRAGGDKHMPVAAPQQPRATSFVASCATFNDSMPRDRALEFGLEGRPFTVAARRDINERALDPDLLVVTPDGHLRRFIPTNTEAAAWREESFALPELAGAVIVGVRASEMDPRAGDEQLAVTISAVTPQGQPLFLIVQRMADGWRRLTPPPGPGRPDEIAHMLAMSLDSGFAGLAGGKIMAFYACVNRRGLSLLSYGFDNRGGTSFLATMSVGQGVDRLVGLRDGNCANVRWEEDGALSLSVGQINPREVYSPIIGVRFEPPRARVRLPIGRPQDASGVRPLVDSLQLCHGVLVRDTDGLLAFVSIDEQGGFGEATRLNGEAKGPARIAETATALGDDGQVHLFATDDAGGLWHAEWSQADGPEALVWTATGHKVRWPSAPPRIAGPPRVFVERAGGHGVDQISRASDGDWVREGVAIGGATMESEPTAVHAIQVSTVTAQSDSVAGALVSVRADRPVIVEHEGRLVRLTPEGGLDIRSNPTGSVRFKMRADGLEAPVLTFSYPDAPGTPPTEFRPQDAALRRMAGLDPRFPVTDEALKASGLLPANLTPDETAKLGDTIRAAARSAYSKGAEQPMQFSKRRMLASADAAPPSEGVTIERTATGFSVTAANDEDVGLTRRGLMATSAADSSSGGFWNWLRGVWQEVKAFTVRVVEGVVQLVVKTASKVMEFLADTARRIGEGLQALLSWINQLGENLVDAGKRAVKWLAESLGWDDVIRAKDAVKAFTRQTLVDLENTVGHAIPDTVHRGLAWARGEVESLFDKAIERFGGQTAGQGERSSASPIRGQLQSNGATALSVQHAVPDRPSERPLFSLSPDFHERVAQMCNRAREVSDNPALKDGFTRLTKLLDGKTNLAEGMSLLLGDVLRLLKPLALLALDLADVIQTLVFELIAKVIRLVREVLERPVTSLGSGFDWVNSFYKGVSGGADLSIVDLSSLLFVTPGVILHRLIVGKPLTPQDQPAPPVETFIAAAPGLLKADQAGDSVQAVPQPPTAITDGAKKFFAWAQPVFAFCSAVWTFLRSIICRIEDVLRIADVSGVPATGTARTVFTWLVRIADYALLGWSLAEMYFTTIGAWIETQVRKNPVLAVFAVAIGVLAVVLVVTTEGFIPAVSAAITALAIPLIWFTAVALLVWGMVMLVVTLVKWIIYAPPPGSNPNREAQFHIRQVASTLLALRQCLQLGVPMGTTLARSGEPVTAAAGAVMIVVNVGGNVLFYGLGGLLMGSAAILAVT